MAGISFFWNSERFFPEYLLLRRLAWRNRGFCMDSHFNRLYLEEALAQIYSFFNSVLQPHCRIRETLLNGRPTISRDELDDLLYRAKKEL